MTTASLTLPQAGSVDRAERRHFIARRAGSMILLAAIGIIFVFPIAWAALSSFKSTNDIITGTFPLSWSSFLPLQPTFENYFYLFTELNFQRNLLNTLIAACGQVGIAVVASSLAGYAFARLRFPGSRVVFALLLLTAFIPVEAIIVPLYRIMQWLGLVSTYPALFLPFACNPFGIFLMRQAFRDIPLEMEEAAKIDGAGPLRVFLTIALPNVKPTLATLVLIQFIWSWNAYLWPLVIMQDPNKQIAQVAIANLKSIPNFPMDGPLFAAATAVTIPLVILSIVLQRYYVRGLVTSGMK
ncbi:sn-glycerol-3-phosphate transport system permease protein UgpE [Youhaiella tibetensis]|uniref:sn-glycerol-3-phosphate transport system permease protein UgpE n=1 Tax=Paradevosia tibetensis TaxID=1447062 RepID=A0A5B9DM49_9HYPH|nr:carbohydrate ABC transporter permease [Youhaiella tibetensis]QEE20106.1 carbohydrate ABC transporter permease [Youhaiella tibetensis]GGF27086.1 sn-glycerol-3-phosphate transport system permease protein UgpE [Youhaiella tibetensis]